MGFDARLCQDSPGESGHNSAVPPVAGNTFTVVFWWANSHSLSLVVFRRGRSDEVSCISIVFLKEGFGHGSGNHIITC